MQASQQATDRSADLNLPHRDRALKWGHRMYVGGDNAESWYGIGKRQYHFLVSQGLRSDHKFLDVACGSLRLGQYIIPMLEKGNYFGIEGEKVLVDMGIENEFLFDVIEKKSPRFSYNYDFDMSFCDEYDFAIAQSLFTHLVKEDISKCFKAMSAVAKSGSKFYFSFFEGDEADNPESAASHANKNWKYSFATLDGIARSNGFECDYIGDWGHERNQMIAVARK